MLWNSRFGREPTIPGAGCGLPFWTPAGSFKRRISWVSGYERVLMVLARVLTDRGTEFCGTSQAHEYELYLAVEDIDHSRTKARSPQTNGICERFHKTVLQEFYQVAFRKRIYTSIEQLQADLDAWITGYREQRPHQGRWCYGKTPMQTFLDTIPLAREKSLAA